MEVSKIVGTHREEQMTCHRGVKAGLVWTGVQNIFMLKITTAEFCISLTILSYQIQRMKDKSFILKVIAKEPKVY